MPEAAPAISIDITQDLESSSDLTKLISTKAPALVQFGSALGPYFGKKISALAGLKIPTFKITASPKWIAGPVTFSATPNASCSIRIAPKGDALPVALMVDSEKTTDVQLAAEQETTYINIDLNLSLSANVSGSGTLNGLTISGKTSLSDATTLCFCQPVRSDLDTLAALKLAFSNIVFPTSPDCADRMTPGSSCIMNFDGKLTWELDVSYGIADHKFSAPSSDLVAASARVGEKIKPPTVDFRGLATASVTYAHTDHFGLVVTKPDAGSACLYLVRSAKNEFGENADFNLGVKVTTPPSVKFDPSRIQTAVQDFSHSQILAEKVASAIGGQVDNLNNAASKKLSSAISDVDATVGLSAGLSQQTSRTALFNFKVDLSQADPAKQSWDRLLTSNIQDVRHIPGFTPEPGSGVTEQSKRAATIQFHFFNLFTWKSEDEDFSNSTVELQSDGTIRVLFDEGIDSKVTSGRAGKSVDEFMLHFTGGATAGRPGAVSGAEVDLCIEIRAKSNPASAAILARIPGQVDPGALPATSEQMRDYAAAHPEGTLELIAVMKASAYRRLSFSPFAGKRPPADQSLDNDNWNCIDEFTVKLMHYPFVDKGWTYGDWQTFNRLCNGIDDDAPANRRERGPLTGVPSGFWKGDESAAVQIGYFLEASAAGMNLFEDVRVLAGLEGAVATESSWQQVRGYVKKVIERDAENGYGKPVGAAILAMAARAGAAVSASTTKSKDGGRFTATLTFS